MLAGIAIEVIVKIRQTNLCCRVYNPCLLPDITGAASSTGGSYTDWFLPSKDELNQMYLNKTPINTTSIANAGTIINEAYHWSSSEYGDDRAMAQSFSDPNNGGLQVESSKSTTFDVRAVRAF